MKLVADHFVPVALNAGRLPDDDAGRFFKALMERWPQGLWVVTPEGKVLAFHYHKPRAGESSVQAQQRWVEDTISMIRAAIREAGPMASRELKARPDPLAGRGRGVGEKGSVRLAVTVTAPELPPVNDSIHLSAEQWAAFSPKEATVGYQWAVEEEIARRFTPALSPMTDPIFSPTPADAKVAKLAGKVFRVEGGIAVVRYIGIWETTHNRDGDPKFPIRTATRGEGVGVYDAKTGKLKAMAWVLSGGYRNGNLTRPMSGIIEWREEGK